MGGGIDTQNLTLAQKGNASTQLLDFIHIVRGEHHRGFPLLLNRLECAPRFFSEVWVKGDRTFIQKQELRVVEKAFTQSDAGMLA